MTTTKQQRIIDFTVQWIQIKTQNYSTMQPILWSYYKRHTILSALSLKHIKIRTVWKILANFLLNIIAPAITDVGI